MRTLVLISVLVASLGFKSMAQNIERSAITSGAGEATSVFGETVQFSIGQAYMTNTLTQNGSNYVTQGFQQPSSHNYVIKETPAYAEATLIKIKAFPNPAVNYTDIALNLIDDDGAKVSIIDMWGQPLKSENYKVTQGKQKLHFVFGEVPAGIYTISVVANKKVYNEKLLVAGLEANYSL